MVFVGYKIEGIDVDRVPTEYLPTGGNDISIMRYSTYGISAT